MSTFVKESFTNHLKQVINVGDEVMYLSNSWGSTDVYTGKFAGVYRGESGRSMNTVVAVRVTDVNRHFGWRGKRDAILPLKRVYKLASTEN